MLLENNEFFHRLTQWNVITALVLAVSAFALMLLTNLIVRKFFASKTPEEQTAVALKIKIACAVVAVVACVLAVIF